MIDTSGNYMTRVLTDEQLEKLKYADAETLQAWISTVADTVAYLDRFEQHFYSCINSGFEVDVEFLLDLHRREATAPDLKRIAPVENVSTSTSITSPLWGSLPITRCGKEMRPYAITESA